MMFSMSRLCTALLIFSFCAFHARVYGQTEYNATVSSGYHHTLFTKTDGSLWTVGRNQYGQLGDGNTVDRNESIKIVNSDVIDVAGGQYHSPPGQNFHPQQQQHFNPPLQQQQQQHSSNNNNNNNNNNFLI